MEQMLLIEHTNIAFRAGLDKRAGEKEEDTFSSTIVITNVMIERRFHEARSTYIYYSL